MAIGLFRARSAQIGGRRTATNQPTIREVCLIGLEHPPASQTSITGQQIVWQGREYQVSATTRTVRQPAHDESRAHREPQSDRAEPPACHYIHLTPPKAD